MESNNILSWTLVIVAVILCIKLYKDSDAFILKCIISDINGNKYCVRDRTKLELAADKLATVNDKLNLLVKYLKEKYPEKECVKILLKNYNPKKLSETLPTSEYTAYSENKGEKLAFCLDTEKDSKGNLIDDNTLMYVALHELSHVASKSIGHTHEFWSNFKFFIIEAEKIKIYEPINYKKNPARYCGINITDNPYYDYP